MLTTIEQVEGIRKNVGKYTSVKKYNLFNAQMYSEGRALKQYSLEESIKDSLHALRGGNPEERLSETSPKVF